MQFQGIKITENDRGMIWVNPFIKKFNELNKKKRTVSMFWQKDKTKDFISSLKRLTKLLFLRSVDDKELYRSSRGKSNSCGTYMHPIVFAEFYSWLFPEDMSIASYTLSVVMLEMHKREVKDMMLFIMNQQIENKSFESISFHKEAALVQSTLKNSNGLSTLDQVCHLNTCLYGSGIKFEERLIILSKYFNN